MVSNEGDRGRNHQRNEKYIAACNFGDQKNSKQRSMHYTGHESGHSGQNEVLFRDMYKTNHIQHA